MSRFVHPLDSQYDLNGLPLDGAKREFFEPGLLVQKDTFFDESLAVGKENTNPVIADGTGRFPEIWLNGDYDVTLRDKNDVPIGLNPLKIESFATSSTSTKLNPLTTSILANDISYSLSDVGVTVPTTKEFSTGRGGGGTYDVVLTSSVTPNGFNIIVGVANDLISFVLRIDNVIWSNQWGADGITFGFDNTPVFDAIVAFVIARNLGANINSNPGEYFFDGLSATDTGANPHKNGILVPFQGFTQNPKIRFVGHGECIFRAGVADLIILRKSTPGVESIGITFEGAGQTNSWGEGVVPEDRDQLVTLVSQSFCKSVDCHYHGCDEGHVEEPGPTVAAAQSGCFYGVIDNCDFNQNLRSVWLKGSISEPTNRPTRCNISSCRAERGNTGFDLQFTTELTMKGNNFQFFDDASAVLRSNTAQAGTANTITLDAAASSVDQEFRDKRASLTGGTGSGQELLIIDYNGTTKIATVETTWSVNPDATTTFDILLHHGTPAAIYIGRKAENNFLYGGSGEANTNDIFNDATNRNGLMIHGFPLSGVNTNVGVLPVLTPQRLRLTTNLAGDVPLEVVYDNDTFVKTTSDSLGDGTKDHVLNSNSVDRMRWFNGETKHFGSAGDIKLNSFGNTVEGTAVSLTMLASGGFLRMRASSDGVFLNLAGTDIVKASAASFRPETDNVTDLGEASLRWEEVFAGIGSINTSDARMKTKVRRMTDDELNASKQLSKEIGIFQFLESIDKKGSSAREHIGMTVQRAIEIMENNGLEPFNYGFICYDEWDEILAIPDLYMNAGDIIEEEIVDKQGNITKETVIADGTELIQQGISGREAGNLYSFRPDQLDRFMIRGLEQRLSDAGI